MATYQLAFIDRNGAPAASGILACKTDEHALASAARLLRNLADYAAVNVRHGDRSLTSLRREELPAD